MSRPHVITLVVRGSALATIFRRRLYGHEFRYVPVSPAVELDGPPPEASTRGQTMTVNIQRHTAETLAHKIHNAITGTLQHLSTLAADQGILLQLPNGREVDITYTSREMIQAIIASILEPEQGHLRLDAWWQFWERAIAWVLVVGTPMIAVVKLWEWLR